MLVLFALQIEETLERLDLHLVMELWFSEQGFGMSGIGESQDRSGNGNANGNQNEEKEKRRFGLSSATTFAATIDQKNSRLFHEK